TLLASSSASDGFKRQLLRKQAVFQKATDLAQAGIATALAITQALPNVVMAAIVGAMGALQMATIAATPIPKYKSGTDFHAGGLAIVGDGGRQELVTYRGQSWVTPDTPTLVDLPRGAAVIPNLDSLRFPSVGDDVIPSADNTPVVVNNDYSSLERKVGELSMILRSLARQQHRDSSDIRYRIFKDDKI
ncbi:MAG: phage tail tape measure protein, partial [Muribaculaceae bacterium]|nr:phage tail tape measure protein [Muribaculaceae bacterium]